MGGGGPQATRIPEIPVGSPGIPSARAAGADAGRPPGPGPHGRPGPRARRLVSLVLPPLALMGLIWFLSAQPDLSSGLKQDFFLRKAAHVTEFAVLTLLWARALAGIGSLPLRRAAPWAAAAIGLAWAAIDERHQHVVEGRVGSLRDVAIDAIGVALALVLLRWPPLRRPLGLRPGPRRTRDR